MKTNIIVFKSKHSTEDIDWAEMSRRDLEDERKEFVKQAKKFINKLKGTDADSYVAEYTKGLQKLFELSSCPVLHFKEFKVEKDKESGVLSFDIYETEKTEKLLLHEVANALTLKDVCSFDDVKLVTGFFKKYMANNACWLSDKIITEGINACTEVIADHSKASKLLPYDGDYDKQYIKDVRDFRKALKHIEKVMAKKYAVYAVADTKPDEETEDMKSIS